MICTSFNIPSNSLTNFPSVVSLESLSTDNNKKDNENLNQISDDELNDLLDKLFIEEIKDDKKYCDSISSLLPSDIIISSQLNNISSNVSSNTIHKIPSVISIDSLSSFLLNKPHTPSKISSDIIPNTPTNLPLDNINHHTSTDLNYINTQEINLAAPSIIPTNIETNIPLNISYITPTFLLSSPLKRKLLSIISFHPFELM